MSYLTFTDPEAAHKKVEAWGENISVLANALYDKYQEMSGPELAQESTRFISGTLFGRKTMGLMCNVFKKVPGKIARKAAEVFRKLQEDERVHITPDGSKIKLQNTNFMDKAREIGGKSKLKNINKKTKEAIKHSKATTKIGKYGKYEDAAYHTKIGNKLKSKAPIDGQHALNNSLRIKNTSPWRIALSNNEFVVLSDTSPGVFHGHVRTWNELTADMQKVLRKAGLVTKKGKIIKQ